MDSANTNTNNDISNWRNGLLQGSRQKVVNKITDTLQKHMPFTGPDVTNELKRIALRFEEKIYATAVDQHDYLRKIALKMLSLRNHPSLRNHASRDGNSLAGHLMLSQMRNTSHLPAIVSGNGISLPEQPQEASLPQNEKVTMTASGMQNSDGLPSTLSSMTNLFQSTGGVVFGTQSAPYNLPGQLLPHNALLQRPQQPVLRQQQSFFQQQPSIFNVSNMQTQQHQQLRQNIQSKTSQYQKAQQLQEILLLAQLPQQLQQQPPLLPQWNSVQKQLQQRIHTPGGLFCSDEEQKQLLQALIQTQSNAPTTSLESSGQTGQSNVIDSQDKIYQKIIDFDTAQQPLLSVPETKDVRIRSIIIAYSFTLSCFYR